MSDMIETRVLKKQGGSVIITLPPDWMKKQSLEEGNTITLVWGEGDLRILSAENAAKVISSAVSSPA